MRPNLFSTAILPALIGAAVFGLATHFAPTLVVRPSIVQPEDVAANKLVTGTSKPVAVPQSSQARKSDSDGTAKVVDSVAWPLVAALALFLLAFSARVKRYLGFAKIIKKVGAAGVELTLDSEAIDQIRSQLRESIDELLDSARNHYERVSSIYQIPSLVRPILGRPLADAVGAKPDGDIRATIHVEDVVFPEFLYQLIDYEPNGAGADRRFSKKYGIIGRSWRLKESLGTGKSFLRATTPETKKRELIIQWGMSEREATGHALFRPSSLSVILRDDHVPVGILYIDSKVADAFGKEADAVKVAKKLEKHPTVQKLAKAISNAVVPLNAISPNLRIANVNK